MKTLYFPVLEQNTTLEEINKKFKEEVEEVQECIINKDTSEHLVEEVLDVIQVCIRMLDILQIKPCEALKNHNQKLLSRGWKYKAQIFIKIE